MATINNSYLGLADLRRQQNKDDTVADIIEILAQQNRMLEHGPAVECNSGMEHYTTVRSGLPTPTWTKLYQGVQPDKGTTVQVKEGTGMLESWSEIDERLIVLAGDGSAKFRFSQATAHIQSMAQAVAQTVIYGDTAADAEKFLGLAPRYNSLTAANGNQIIDAGGTGSDNTSIWFIGWGENGTHFLYPKGTQAGIQREDLGIETKNDPAKGGLYRVAREKFCMHVGLSVRDWRVNARVANIDVSNLNNDASGSSANLIDKMIDAYYALDNPNRTSTKTVIYCSRNIAQFLHKQAMHANNNMHLRLDEVDGKRITMFLGHEIHQDDAILHTEARVV